MTEVAEDSRFLTPVAPQEGVQYPLQVFYCGVCSMPFEYCDFTPNPDKCKDWLKQNLPDEFEKLSLAGASGDVADGDGEEKKKRQTRGGRGVVKTKKKTTEPQTICLSKAPRGKKKFVTVVTGLATYDISLKVASKFFGARFACGSSVTGDDEIVIQGDVKDELFDIIPEKWPEIDEDNIDYLGNMKR